MKKNLTINRYAVVIVLFMTLFVFVLPHYAQKNRESFVNQKVVEARLEQDRIFAEKLALEKLCADMGAHVENGACEYSKKEIEARIVKFFPRSHVDMIAVMKAESKYNLNAKNWNCYYYQGKATTTPIKNGGRSCKVEDRSKAFSYDCGIMQLNQKSPKCPVETLDKHLQRAAALSRIQGKEAWVTYNNGMYEEHLAENK